MSAYKCNLVLAGFGKCGTSSLHAYLALHPRIAMSKKKEPHYFSIEKIWERGAVFHNSLFELNGKIDVAYYGESSTTYCASEAALKRISEQLVEPKIIFIVRNPVERVLSHYRWMYALGLENRSILAALEKDGFGFDPNRSVEGNYMSYLQISSYSKYLPLWQEKFGEKNILVLFTDELGKNPDGVMDHCFAFLGLPPIGGLTEINKNQTDCSSRLVSRPIAKGMNKYVPEFVRSGLKKIPLVAKIWKATTQYRIKLPSVSTEEMCKVAGMLSDEMSYYKKLRAKYSLFD